MNICAKQTIHKITINKIRSLIWFCLKLYSKIFHPGVIFHLKESKDWLKTYFFLNAVLAVKKIKSMMVAFYVWSNS